MHPASQNTAESPSLISLDPAPNRTESLVRGPTFVIGSVLITIVMSGLAPSVHAQFAHAQFATTGPAAASSPQTSVWPKREFKLPVEISPEGRPPTELQLFVAQPPSSRVLDGGTQTGRPTDNEPQPDWTLVGRKPFPADHFDFVSPQDGTYWFAIRTLDSSGVSSPTSLRPDVSIFVDTQEPKILIEADASDAGTVRGEVLIQDATAIRQFQLQYHTDDASTWTVLPAESVRVIAAAGDAGERRIFEFTPPGDWRRLTVRASAADSANHVSHLNQLIERPRLAVAPSPRYASNTNGPSPGATSMPPFRPALTPTVGVPARIASGPVRNQQPITRKMSATPPAGYSAVAAAQRSGSTPSFGQSPFSETIPTPPAVASPNALSPSPGFGLAPSNLSTFGSPPALNAPVTDGLDPTNDRPVTRPNVAEDSISNANDPRWEPKTSPRDSRWDPSQIMNAPRSVEDALRPLTPRPEIPGDDQLDPDPSTKRRNLRPSDLAGQSAPVRHSDSPRFSLEYELEAVGSSGADAIELWGSTDGGISWKKWGEDPDRASPFDIETKGDGVFGFRIVVIGGNGLNSPAPRTGESADINVVVDQQAPKTRITGAQYGEGDAIGCLVIRYECIDDFLSTRPVTLAFSPNPNGPWTTIAGGLRNDGQYIWPADPGLPRQMHLRITATDKAGNVGSFQLDQPIDTQGLAPRARIRGFQILSDRNPAATPDEQTAERPRATFK